MLVIISYLEGINLTEKILDWQDCTERDAVSGLAGVVEASIKKTVTGSSYLNCTLTNGKDTINAKKWNYSEEPPTGTVMVIGKIDSYKGKKQLVLQRIYSADVQLDLRRRAPKDAEHYHKICCRLLEEASISIICHNGDRKTVSEPFMVLHKIGEQALKMIAHSKQPAAKSNHHAYVNGLLEHTYEVLSCATSLCRSLGGHQLLTAVGAILHDIGKLEELAWKGMEIQYTDKGELSGHIAIGVQILHELWDSVKTECPELSRKRVDVVLNSLEHIILSHHGFLEYGSPIEPKFKEAYFVHLADMASSHSKYYDKAVPEKPEGLWSTRIFPLNRRVYLGNKLIEKENLYDEFGEV